MIKGLVNYINIIISLKPDMTNNYLSNKLTEVYNNTALGKFLKGLL